MSALGRPSRNGASAGSAEARSRFSKPQRHLAAQDHSCQQNCSPVWAPKRLSVGSVCTEIVSALGSAGLGYYLL